jgi:hypothetical protein
VPRKVTAQQPQRRREGVNRAQLKALAARQAMTSAAVATARPVVVDEGDEEAVGALPSDYSSPLLRGRRRVTLTREQEFEYIRRDLIRLAFFATGLLALLVVLLFVLR